MKKYLLYLLIMLGALVPLSIVLSAEVSAVHTPLAPWLCDDGTFTSETQDGACERLGKTTVSTAIRDRCHSYPTPEERVNCIRNPQDTTIAPLATDCSAIDEDNCAIFKFIVIFIRILSAAVGTVIVVMVAVGGVQYTTARDNPQNVAAARQRIFNALLALVIYMGMMAFLQWLVPGGVFIG